MSHCIAVIMVFIKGLYIFLTFWDNADFFFWFNVKIRHLFIFSSNLFFWKFSKFSFNYRQSQLSTPFLKKRYDQIRGKNSCRKMILSFLAKASLIMVAWLPELDTTCAIQCQSYIVKVTKIDNVTYRFLIPKRRWNRYFLCLFKKE